MNLYLKYRPKTIFELDLARVREVLLRTVANNKVDHAYLLTGPRGAGKTSCARILARVVNCEKNQEKLAEPCNTCGACQDILLARAMDVVEIDAASNRGIDDMRDLKEKIRLAPLSLPYKVYIIDEVHMLTTEAFNALLKTLEEPPTRTIFVLCTTELAKVPETIVSRCVQIPFYKASKEEMARSLARVAVGEGVILDDSVIELLAKRVDGSFRDGVKMLEQVISLGGEISTAKVEELLGMGSSQEVESWISAVLAKDTKRALTILREVFEKGVDLGFFLASAIASLRAGILLHYDIEVATKAKATPVEDVTSCVSLIKSVDEVARKLASTTYPLILCEMMVIEWVGGEGSPSGLSGSSKKENSEDNKEVKTEKVVAKTDKITDQKKEEEYHDQMMDGAKLRSMWRKMLSEIDKSQYSLEALLSKARPLSAFGKTLVVAVAYDFHKTQLESARFREKIHALVADTFGMPLSLEYRIEKDSLQMGGGSGSISDEAHDLIASAEEIFV